MIVCRLFAPYTYTYIQSFVSIEIISSTRARGSVLLKAVVQCCRGQSLRVFKTCPSVNPNTEMQRGCPPLPILISLSPLWVYGMSFSLDNNGYCNLGVASSSAWGESFHPADFHPKRSLKAHCLQRPQKPDVGKDLTKHRIGQHANRRPTTVQVDLQKAAEENGDVDGVNERSHHTYGDSCRSFSPSDSLRRNEELQ